MLSALNVPVTNGLQLLRGAVPTGKVKEPRTDTRRLLHAAVVVGALLRRAWQHAHAGTASPSRQSNSPPKATPPWV